MGFIYQRPGTAFWWLAFQNADGQEVRRSSKTRDEAIARKMLAEIEAAIGAQVAAGLKGPLTLEKYAKEWFKEREKAGVHSIRDDRGRWKWIASTPLAAMSLGEIRRSHVRDFMRELPGRKTKRGDAPSSRQQLHIYGLLRVMFSDAVVDELVPSTPCTLKERKKELPKKRDKDLRWRPKAVFERREVEALISDERVPEDRRVLYALLFLSGARFGEIADRAWGDYDPDAHPLGRLSVFSSFSVRSKESKETKTGVAREVPVHPALAAILAAWKLGGWARLFNRKPKSADPIIPSRWGAKRRVNHALRRLHQDLEALGLRKRRIHDTRRTFVSLATADGADRSKLEWVTHDGKGDIFDSYNSPPWESLCNEVSKLRIAVLKGEMTVRLQSIAGMKNAPKPEGLEALKERGVRDLNPSRVSSSEWPSLVVSRGSDAEGEDSACDGAPDCKLTGDSGDGGES